MKKGFFRVFSVFIFEGFYARVKFFRFFVILAFLVLFVKSTAVFMSVKKTGRRNTFEALNADPFLPQQRADILDRNGILLARTMVASDLYLVPSKVFDVDEDVAKLLSIFPEIQGRVEYIKEQLNSDRSSNALVLIKKGLWPNHKEKILSEGVTGVYFDNSYKRIYPYKHATSHLLGMVSADGDGASGIESFFDKRLKSHPLQPLVLSIDANIQSIVRSHVAGMVSKYSAKGGFGLIMNVKTGEVISAVSLPDFNPNNLSVYEESVLFNNYSLGVYELGSVFKVFLLALAMEANIPLDRMYEIGDSYEVDDFKIRDFRFSRHKGKMSLVDIMRYSSNIGCAKLMSEISPLAQREMFSKLLFSEKLNIEIPERGFPLVPKKWYRSNIITASYGHGIAVTPLHFLNAASGIVNDGILLEPTFLKVDSPKGVKVVGRVLSKEASRKVRMVLSQVVEHGTGKKGMASKYEVGGKTGTAIQSKNGKYDFQNVILSFFATVPSSRPEYIFYIGLISPKLVVSERFLTGGYVTAPVIGEIVTTAGPMLNISMKK